MNNKIVYGILMVFIFAIFSSLVYQGQAVEKVLATYNVKIEKDRDGIWRVRDTAGANKGTMKVNKRDTINWHAKGSEMIFIFSKDVSKYFTFEDSLFTDGRHQKIEKNKMLKLTIKDSVLADTLHYEVYVVGADELVVGNSPPKIIIN